MLREKLNEQKYEYELKQKEQFDNMNLLRRDLK
jgi:hypothetical protein